MRQAAGQAGFFRTKPSRRMAWSFICGYNLKGVTPFLMRESMQISTREFKTHLSAVLRRVRAGEEISVTSHGKVVARLSPPLAEEHSAPEQLRGQPWVRAGKAGAVRGAARPTSVPDGTVDEVVRWVRGD